MVRRLHVTTAGLIPWPWWRFKIAATPRIRSKGNKPGKKAMAKS
jgi:hypothetical protein